jgi:GNAT superfamily N-acetyltransferase
VRRARAGEHEALSDLAVRSKAHWGYPPELIEAWRADLAVPADGPEVWVADLPGRDAPAGVLVLAGGEVDMLFVDPGAMGHGVGRALWEHALERARALGWSELLVEADPNARGFYEAMGAEVVGERPSAVVPGRALPLLRAVVVTPPAYSDGTSPFEQRNA